MNISLCVSVPDDGLELLELLLETASRLASGEHQIDLHYTCHGEEQYRLITKAGLALPIGRHHIVPCEPQEYFQANSVTHSRCINALFEGSNADISVMCDYDGAFVARDWDQTLVRIICGQGIAFLGSPYSANPSYKFELSFGKVDAYKYQGKPNAIFVAYAPSRIKALTQRICSFEALYASPQSLPLRFVANVLESRQFGLPIGTFAHLDTGTPIAELIEQHQLPAMVFSRKVRDYEIIHAPADFDSCPEVLRPEEYGLNDSPYFVHLRKGSSRSRFGQEGGYSRTMFIRDINRYLDAIS